MNINTKFVDLFPTKVQLKKTVQIGERTASIAGGRVSRSEGETSVLGYLTEMMLLKPDFNLQLLSAIEHLAMYHGDVSYAVENIVSLGNTPYQVYFSDDVTDEAAKEMKLHLKQKARYWYVHSGGLNSMINDLLAQVAIFGALSAESIPNNDLTGIRKNVLVSPKSIRFKYDKQHDEYIPIQVMQETGISVPSTDIELNSLTYKYISLRRFSEKPYGIPPFLAALGSVAAGIEMTESMKSVIRNLGVLGFLEVLVNAPKPAPMEDDETYYNRTKNYLDRIRPEIEKGVDRGFVMGFKDLQSFEMKPTTSSASGVEALVELNDKKTFSGLKQDGLMFGRTFNTTETLGRVILAKMLTQTANYQRVVATYLQDLFILELNLAGYDVRELEVEFEPPLIGDRDKEATARSKEIDNATKLYNAGIISQQQRAIELGYEQPDQEEPRSPFGNFSDLFGEDDDDSQDGKTDPNKDKDTDVKEEASNIISGIHLGAGREEFPYHVHLNGKDCGCSPSEFTSMLMNRERLPLQDEPENINDFVRLYFDATRANFYRAIRKSTYSIGRALADLGEGATVEQVQDTIFYHLYVNWGTTFSRPQAKIIHRFVQESYKFFRTDKSIFKGVSGTPPDATFSLVDRRALEYFKRSDSYYLGKFITDESAKRSLSEFIKKEYLNGNIPLGRNTVGIKEFRKRLGNNIQMQDWKIAQIIDTTVSRLRNTAAVAYYDQAEISEYEIRGVNDRLQCDYCSALQGKRFSVTRTVRKLNDTFLSDPTLVKADAPFITSIGKSPDDVSNMSGNALQDMGFDLVPAHPNCRDTIAAV